MSARDPGRAQAVPIPWEVQFLEETDQVLRIGSIWEQGFYGSG